MKTKVSPVLFVVTVLCFFLPFVTVSCGGIKISVSGMKLAFGGKVSMPFEDSQPFGFPQQPPQRSSTSEKGVDAHPVAIIALLCALAGIGLSFTPVRSAIAPAIAGALGALFLIILQSQTGGELKAQGPISVEMDIGYVFALLLFIGAAGWNGWLFYSSRAPATAAGVPRTNAAAVGGGPPAATPGSFCPHCGSAMAAGGKFCGVCGKAV